jgi:hypothetical protein
MTQVPVIPMSPDQLPQQRIHEVVDLIERPEPFNFEVGYGSVPQNARGKGKPKSATYLGQVEWAWSPMHNRLDAYYLHRGRRHWVLLSQYWDDNWGKWEWVEIGYVPRKGVCHHQAAVHLLLEYWKSEEVDSDLDEFHWINTAAGLSVSELMAIAREVWD